MSERDIFLAALDIPDIQARRAYLDRACGDDAALRRGVDALLAAHAEAGSFMEHPGSAGVPPALSPVTTDLGGDPPDRTSDHTPDDPPPADAPGGPADALAGTLVGGRYRLVEPIGEGGMGAVWRAEQTEPVRRPVAVKLIKAGMDSRAVLRRFEAERQALAVMDHPNIARVFDAGATEAGRPYFVMELVQGVPITRYCDARRLTPRQRLELFVPVCQAIQHAHQKGVIHRDIKPGNVLVAEVDGRPVPKVIDFGVAKATGPELAGGDAATGFGAVVGTPEYMSPEQASFNQLDVDTRSDVYALGVLLYELLTGATPVDRKSLGRAVVLEVLRVVREVDPPRPSQKLSTADALPSIAAVRGTEPRHLTRLVRGELDWIVMKALEKDRARRYESVNGFAADVGRYLAGEAVQAAPPSKAYRVRTFVRRHRAGVTAAGLVAAALVLGIAGTTWGLVEARAQRDAADTARQAESDRAEGERVAKDAEAAQKRVAEEKASAATAAREFLQSVLVQGNPERASRDRAADPNRTLRAALDFASKEIEGKFAGQPDIAASLRSTIGAAYLHLGAYDAAGAHLRAALDLRERAPGPDHPDTLMSVNNLADLYSAAGDPAAAERLYRRALAGRERALGGDHPDTLQTVNNLARLHGENGEFEAAEPLLVRALAGREKALGPNHPDTLTTAGNLGQVYQARRDYRAAEPLLVRALEGEEKALGPDHQSTLTSVNNLACLYEDKGDPVAAEPLFRRALAGHERVLGADHPRTLAIANNLAMLYRATGDYRAAEPLLVRALAGRERVLGADHRDTLTTAGNLGMLLTETGRPDEAVPLLERAYAARAKYPTWFDGIEKPLIDAYTKGRRPADAARVVGEGLTEGRAKLKPGSPELSGLLAQTGKQLLDLDPAVAEPVLRECLGLREKLAPKAWNTANAKSLLGGALLGQGKAAEAEPLLVAGYTGLVADRKSIPPIPAAQANLPDAADRLVELYEKLGKPDEVKKWRAERAKYPIVAPPPRPATRP